MHMSCCVSFSSSDDSKQDSDTTIEHIKCIIELFKQHNLMSNMLIKIWENTDGCAEHYKCSTSLQLMSMLSHEFYVIIDHSISAPGHVRELVDGLTQLEKGFPSN